MRAAPRKAFLLAAGRGERLQPLTRHKPKCLVDVGGKPMLGHWLDRMWKHGVREVLVNTHHLSGQVEAYLRARLPDRPRTVAVHEPVLLGSAGTVAAHRSFVQGESDFLIAYADNLTNIDLSRLAVFHRQRRPPLTMVLFRPQDPSSSGMVRMETSGRIVSFEEKPAHSRAVWANAGLYMAGPALLDALPRRAPADFGHDVLPGLAGKMYGYAFRGLFHDIGTKERLQAARRAWARRQKARGTGREDAC